jgi:hypothetical protein
VEINLAEVELLGCYLLFELLAFFAFHHKIRRSKPGPFEEQVEISPFEHQFGHMVDFRLFEKTHRSYGGEWIFPGQWFLVVVKVDDVGFPEA